MDGQHFDELSRTLAVGASRRHVLRGVATAAAAGVTAHLFGWHIPRAQAAAPACDYVETTDCTYRAFLDLKAAIKACLVTCPLGAIVPTPQRPSPQPPPRTGLRLHPLSLVLACSACIAHEAVQGSLKVRNCRTELAKCRPIRNASKIWTDHGRLTEPAAQSDSQPGTALAIRGVALRSAIGPCASTRLRANANAMSLSSARKAATSTRSSAVAFARARQTRAYSV